MKLLSRVFLKGLAVIVPIAGTLAIVAWIGSIITAIAHSLLKPVLPDSWSFPGMGFLLGIGIVFGIGLLAHLWIFEKLFGLFGKILARAPLVKAIYGSLKDLSEFVFPVDAKAKKLGRSVIVKLDKMGLSAIGFEMVTDLKDHPLGKGAEGLDQLIVYFPMSYQLGGYMAIVDKEDVIPLDLSVEEALKLTLTAGITGTAERKG